MKNFLKRLRRRATGFAVRYYTVFGDKLIPIMAGGAVEVRTDFGGAFVIAGVTVDPANVGIAAAANTASISVPGVRVNDYLLAIPSQTLEPVVVQSAWVQAADLVTIRVANPSAGAIDAASKADWAFIVFRR